ncbi:hypothetical protein EDD22DRAFT_853213 [Suillus occidentalis]|nr:hypothetical protein EDD22DRAFT_853213 [Suillus occidentalis]
MLFVSVDIAIFIDFLRMNEPMAPSTAITPIWTGSNVLTPDPTGDEENRPAGLGSPRDSGDDEADTFLRRSTATDPERRPSPVSPLPPGAAPPRIVGSTGSDRTRSSQASTDYGVVLPGSGHFGQAYSGDGIPAHPSSKILGHIVSPGELLSIGDEEEPEDIPQPPMHSSSHPSLPEHIAPLLPPPSFEGSTMRKPSDRSLLNEKEKSVRSASYPTSDIEDSKVFTARRVRVQELGSRSPQDDDSTNTQPVAGPGSWRNSFSSAKELVRIFVISQRIEFTQGTDKDAEAAQSLLGAGLVNTVYHDAVSRMGTPVSLPSRAITPASQRGSAVPATDFAPSMPSGAPPAYDDPYDLMGSRGHSPLSPTGIDVLDIPAQHLSHLLRRMGGLCRQVLSRCPVVMRGEIRCDGWKSLASGFLGENHVWNRSAPASSARVFNISGSLTVHVPHYEEYEDLFAEPGRRTSILGPMPSFSARSMLSQPTIRSVGGTTATSDDTEATRTTVTSGSEDAMSMPTPWFQERVRAEI